MVEIDHSELIQLVRERRLASDAYFRTFILWLGLGCAGGAVATATWAMNLPEPDFALRMLLPSLWSYFLGLLAAGFSLLVASRLATNEGLHFAAAYNRDEFNLGAAKIPEIIASPKSIAERENAFRNQLLKRAGKEHADAESSWDRRELWQRCLVIGLAIASSALVAGIGWPLALLSLGGGFTQ